MRCGGNEQGVFVSFRAHLFIGNEFGKQEIENFHTDIFVVLIENDMSIHEWQQAVYFGMGNN